MSNPTTQISLIREHTETIKPPRALWVPFELGRPLGLPNDPAFQRRVLLAALELFDLPEGPVLVDFPDDVPEQAADARDSLDHLACPVSFAPLSQEQTETEKLLSAFRSEVTEFRSWYDIGLGKRGYSAIAYFSPDAAGRLLMDFIQEEPLKFPKDISSPATALRFAARISRRFTTSQSCPGRIVHCRMLPNLTAGSGKRPRRAGPSRRPGKYACTQRMNNSG